MDELLNLWRWSFGGPLFITIIVFLFSGLRDDGARFNKLAKAQSTAVLYLSQLQSIAILDNEP